VELSSYPHILFVKAYFYIILLPVLPLKCPYQNFVFPFLSAITCHMSCLLFRFYFITVIIVYDVARMGEQKGVHRVLVGNPEGKRPLGRPRRKWEDNIKMDVQVVGGGRGDWMELAQDRDRWRALVSTVKNLRVP
jgi:hypothetical protein